MTQKVVSHLFKNTLYAGCCCLLTIGTVSANTKTALAPVNLGMGFEVEANAQCGTNFFTGWSRVGPINMNYVVLPPNNKRGTRVDGWIYDSILKSWTGPDRKFSGYVFSGIAQSPKATYAMESGRHFYGASWAHSWVWRDDGTYKYTKVYSGNCTTLIQP